MRSWLGLAFILDFHIPAVGFATQALAAKQATSKGEDIERAGRRKPGRAVRLPPQLSMKSIGPPAKLTLQKGEHGTSVMKSISRLAGAAIALLAAAAVVQAADPVVIGLEIPLSPPGDPASGQLIRRGGELAIEYINGP